jgi:hypothetical protein
VRYSSKRTSPNTRSSRLAARLCVRDVQREQRYAASPSRLLLECGGIRVWAAKCWRG